MRVCANVDVGESSHGDPKPGEPSKEMKKFEGIPPHHTQNRFTFECLLTFRTADINSEADLMPPGGQPGTIPTDLEQATGLERLEILGKMQGVDIFDMRPLDASRVGTYTIPHRTHPHTTSHRTAQASATTRSAWLTPAPQAPSRTRSA